MAQQRSYRSLSIVGLEDLYMARAKALQPVPLSVKLSFFTDFLMNHVDYLVWSMSWHSRSLSMGRMGTSMGVKSSRPPSLTILEVSSGQLCCSSCRVICTKPEMKIQISIVFFFGLGELEIL